MEYGLVGTIERDRVFVPLDSLQYAKIKHAKSALVECVYIEETYDILVENYLEFETTLLDLGAREMVTRAFRGYDSFHTARGTLDRRLANLLSASRAYQDHVPKRLHSALPLSRPEIKEKLSEQYDKELGYRCMEELRNHVQHCGLPVHSVTAQHHWTSLGENGMLLFGVTPYLDAKHLKSDSKFKKRVLDEIEAAGGRLDLNKAVRQYMEGLSAVHAYVRDIVAASCEEWEEVLKEALAKLNEASKEPGEAWWCFAVRGEGDQVAEEFDIFTEFVDRLRLLQQKNETPLANLSRRFVSSQLTGN